MNIKGYGSIANLVTIPGNAGLSLPSTSSRGTGSLDTIVPVLLGQHHFQGCHHYTRSRIERQVARLGAGLRAELRLVPLRIVARRRVANVCLGRALGEKFAIFGARAV